MDRHYYSVPYFYVRRQVTVKITEQLVEVFYEHQRIAAHPRSPEPYRHSTLEEHMPPEHWAYKNQSKDRFLAWADQVGPQTRIQVEAVFASKAYEEQAFRTLKGIQSLATRYGKDRLEAACKRANVLGMVGYRRLKTMLRNQRQDSPVLVDLPQPQPINHDNVRGSAYYN